MAKQEQQEEVVEKQVPEKPKKQQGMSLPIIIGIVFGVVVFQAILIIVLFKMFIQVPQPETETSKKGEHSAVKSSEESGGKVEGEMGSDPKLVKMFETGRIMTNPKGSPSQYVIVDMAIFYKIFNEQAEEEIMKELTEMGEGGGGGHGGGAAVVLFSKRQQTRLKGAISSLLGSLSIEELQAKRDSLPNMIKNTLKPIINDQAGRIKINEVVIQEFMIQ